MASKRLSCVLFGSKQFIHREYTVIQRTNACYFSTGAESSDQEEEVYPLDWYEKAFKKMKKWSHPLKEMDLVHGRLVNADDHSRVFDDKLEHKMHTFKSIAKIFVGYPLVQETMRKNLKTEFSYFGHQNERKAIKVNSLTKVADTMSISAQQRKVVRHTILPQVTQHHIWTGALLKVLKELKLEIDVLINQHPNKEIFIAHQIIVNCLMLLESSTSYDPESTSWMRLTPTKTEKSTVSNSAKWEDVLEMFTDLVNYLSEEKEVVSHVEKLEAMKQGLYQTRDFSIDKNVGYKENRYQEHLVQKKLVKSLGHSSKCLFSLLLYYLYGIVKDIEVELHGGVRVVGNGRSCLYFGKILMSGEERVVLDGIKQLERSLGLFKFVWDASGVKGDLELQGHMWCVGSDYRSIPYRGNMYFLHGINV